MKVQSAIEYLSTYGWAILIIAVVLSALFAMGVFSYHTQECLLQAGLGCLAYSIAQNGLLSLNIVQLTQSPINVTAIGCYTSPNAMNMQLPYNPPSNQIYMAIGANYTFGLRCYQGNVIYKGKLGSEYMGFISVNYTDTTTGLPQVGYGKIALQVTQNSVAP